MCLDKVRARMNQCYKLKTASEFLCWPLQVHLKDQHLSGFVLSYGYLDTLCINYHLLF